MGYLEKCRKITHIELKIFQTSLGFPPKVHSQTILTISFPFSELSSEDWTTLRYLSDVILSCWCWGSVTQSWWWAGWYADWCEQEQLVEDSSVLWERREERGETEQFTILQLGTFRPLSSATSHQHYTISLIHQPSTSTSIPQIIKGILYAFRPELPRCKNVKYISDILYLVLPYRLWPHTS